MSAAAPAIESSTREGEEPVKVAPGSEINKLSDKFRDALASSPKEAAIAAKDKAETPPAEPKAAKVEPAPQPHAKDKPPSDKEKNFRALETSRDEFKTKWEQETARVKEFESKLKETEARIPADYDDLKKKVEHYSDLEKRYFVEHSPEFRQAYTDKITAGIEEAKEIAGAEGEAIAELLALPPSKRREAEIEKLTEEMSDFKKTQLAAVMRDVKRLQKERASELGKATEGFQQLMKFKADERGKAQLQSQEAADRAYKLTVAEAAKKSVHFQRIDGNEEHNGRVVENEKMLREFTTADLKPEERSKLAFMAVRGIRSYETDQIKDALIQKLQGELKEIQAATPGASGGGAAKSGGKPMTAAERYNKAINEGIPEKGS